MTFFYYFLGVQSAFKVGPTSYETPSIYVCVCVCVCVYTRNLLARFSLFNVVLTRARNDTLRRNDENNGGIELNTLRSDSESAKWKINRN